MQTKDLHLPARSLCALARAAFLLTMAGITGCGEELEEPQQQQEEEETLLVAEQGITNGTKANARDYFASLQVNTTSGWQHICGATLLSSKRLLTAAHCIDDPALQNAINFGAVRVCVGVRNLKRCTADRVAEVRSFEIHPKWKSDRSAYGYDVAVLRVKSKKFKNFKKVKLARTNKHDPKVGEESRSFGWGYTEKSKLPSILQKVSLPRLPGTTCKAVKNYLGTSGPLLCTDVVQDRSICNGDSGGPMMFQGRQVGVHSFGLIDPNQTEPGARCAQGILNASARVSKLDDWIRSAAK